jgi:hypothetical protein
VTHVWLAQVEEVDDEGHTIHTGRFDCEFEERGRRESAEGLPFAEALAWARARSDRVRIDAEGTRFSAGATPDRELPGLSPDVAERLERGSRRPYGDEWIDRDGSAPPTRWEVKVELSPDALAREDRAKQEQVVSRAAGEPEGFGWMIPQSLAFELVAVIQAPTHRPLLASVREAILEEVHVATGFEPYERGASDTEGRWGVEIDVHPPGYQPPPHRGRPQ